MHPHRFRFFVSASDTESVSVEGAEHVHLAKVLRLPVGTEIEVFDGTGWVAQGCIESLASKIARVRITQVAEPQPKKPACIVCLGALKPNSCDDLLPPLVELGVDAFHLFLSEGTARYRGSESAQARWQRILLTAVKQCKRPTIPTIEVWSSWSALLQGNPFPMEAQRWVLDPDATTSLGTGLDKQRSSVLAIGSEKGFSASENTGFREAGFAPVALGTSILRATTAAIAGVAVLAFSR